MTQTLTGRMLSEDFATRLRGLDAPDPGTVADREEPGCPHCAALDGESHQVNCPCYAPEHCDRCGGPVWSGGCACDGDCEGNR